MESMRVLVTGANGFVGRWVTKALVQRGHAVIGVGRGGRSASHAAEVAWCVADLLCQSDIENLIRCERPEGLVHCAWDTTPGSYWASSDNLKWVASSLHLVEAFVKHGGHRAVIAGTSAEYCWKAGGLLNETTSRIQPNSLYGVCKNSLREMVEQWASKTDLSWAWGRVFCPFGPDEKAERLVPRLISQLQKGKPVPFDSGSLIRDFLSVQDLGDAFAAVFESDAQGCINLGSGIDLSIRQLVEILAKDIAGSRVDFGKVADPTGQPERLVADVTRLTEEVGWAPQESLDVRLRETVDWWRGTPGGMKTSAQHGRCVGKADSQIRGCVDGTRRTA